ncbi:MAG: hypothetical protein IJT19_06275 [Bacteroidaceae bacterium]|nr:hypothetical protein [Bacteroidaceae bacterium]
MRRVIWLIMAAALSGLVLTGCDKLDDGDDGIINEVLPGKWAFSYTFKDDADPGLEFQYRYVLFREDGTCDLVYIADGDALHGTYQATRAMIRIVSSDIGDEERVIVWKITSFSAKQLVAEYSFDMNGQSFTAVVTLEKQ